MSLKIAKQLSLKENLEASGSHQPGLPASNLPRIGAVPTDNPLSQTSEVQAMLAGIGANIVRVQILWQDVETSVGVYSWPTYTDNHGHPINLGAYITTLRAAGNSLDLLPNYGNTLYTPVWNDPPDSASYKAFANFVAWVVGQFNGPDVYYEIYNEPNIGGNWGGTASAVSYGNLLQQCIQTVRAIPVYGATAKIISAGIGDPGTLPGSIAYPVFGNVTSSTVGSNITKLAAQTLHPYDSANPPESVFNFDSVYQAAVPYHGPLCFSEWGYSETWGIIAFDQTKYALYIARMIGCSIFANVLFLIIYGLFDTGTNPSDPEQNFGLYTSTQIPKLAATAVTSMTTALAGTIRYVTQKIGTVYQITLYKTSHTVVRIVWTDASTISYLVPMNSVVSYHDTLGNTPSGSVTAAGLTVTLGPTVAPIIVTGT
jgi:uncharacterized membrane protein